MSLFCGPKFTVTALYMYVIDFLVYQVFLSVQSAAEKVFIKEIWVILVYYRYQEVHMQYDTLIVIELGVIYIMK